MRYFCPIAYTLLVWWLSTGLIVYLDGLPRRTFRWTLLGATALLGAALYQLRASGADTTAAGAYVSFTAGVLAWGWLEVGFLMGPLTGPWKRPCPPECRGWSRVGLAIRAVLYHELAIIGLAAMIAALCWQADNRVGMWTFAVLWIMRVSAKLNVFLGVRNLNEQFLPEHLRYMHTYFRQRPSNGLFPVSVIAVTVLAGAAWHSAVAMSFSAFEVTACSFVAMLLSLALLEHWFMVLPLPSEKLWDWGMRSRVAPLGEPRREA